MLCALLLLHCPSKSPRLSSLQGTIIFLCLASCLACPLPRSNPSGRRGAAREVDDRHPSIVHSLWAHLAEPTNNKGLSVWSRASLITSSSFFSSGVRRPIRLVWVSVRLLFYLMEAGGRMCRRFSPGNPVLSRSWFGTPSWYWLSDWRTDQGRIGSYSLIRRRLWWT